MRSFGKNGILVGMLAVAMLLCGGNAFAVPDLQVTVPGTYDTGTDTWTYIHNPGVAFDMTVISAKKAKSQVFVSLALLDIDGNKLSSGADLSSVSIVFDGTTYTGTDFTHGKPVGISGGHGIFNTQYTVVDVGAFDLSQTVNDTEPGETGTDSGQARDFEVTISGDYAVHFDAYYWDGKKYKSNPSSHDAESTPVPEPTTFALLGMGMAGMLGYKGRKRFFLKKS